MRRWTFLVGACAIWGASIALQGQIAAPAPAARAHAAAPAFVTSDSCLACHNGLTTPAGEDVSIGVSWRASMMANAARDPYWQAAVRRETIDHPSKRAAIEDECSICHMPMATTLARAAGRHGEVFSVVPTAQPMTPEQQLAADGVSCALCHQIGPERLGTRESFVGGFVVAAADGGTPRMLGPFDVDAGRAAMMRSATGVTPAKGEHIRQSEVCATCHTLFTEAFGANGEVIGSIAEQAPYLEWRHSAFVRERSCQSCHMPQVDGTPVASVLGEPRDGAGRHTFLGGNAFMLRLLNRFRTDLAVTAPALELEAAANATVRQLQTETVSLAITRATVADGTLEADVSIRNLTGHKLPTGYPSRRVWLHVTVRDASGVLFESGAFTPTGAVEGNDNDADATRFEPHYTEIRRPEEVQIYEAVMARPDGRVTTGLLQATQYVKDNRLLPRGFDKASAGNDIGVQGEAARDADFTDAGDRVRYLVPIAAARGPVTIEAELRYQTIGFRWAANLRGYDAAEPRRFVSYYEATAASSSTVLARTERRVAAGE